MILFDDTIKSNIAYANSGASQKDIEEACKFAAADEFIQKLPSQYETIVREWSEVIWRTKTKNFNSSCPTQAVTIILG